MHWYKLCILEARYPAVESFSGRYLIRRGSLEIPTNTECDNLHVFACILFFVLLSPKIQISHMTKMVTNVTR